MIRNFFTAIVAAYIAFVGTFHGTSPITTTEVPVTTTTTVVTQATPIATTLTSVVKKVQDKQPAPGASAGQTSAQGVTTETGTTTLSVQLLAQQLDDLIAQQKRQFQPNPPPIPPEASTTPTIHTPIVQDTSTPAPTVLPQKVIYAVLVDSSVTLQTTFPVDFHSIKIIAFDHFQMSGTTTLPLLPNVSEVTATKNHDGTYSYVVPFSTPLDELFATYSPITPTFQVSFADPVGLATTSQPFAFSNGLPSFVPSFNIKDVMNATIILKF